MNDIVVDSSVVAKWLLPEADSPIAQQVMSDVTAKGGRLIVLDLALPEVANTIWKRVHRGIISLAEAQQLLALLLRLPVQFEPAAKVVVSAVDIACRYDRSVYDSLFVGLSRQLGLRGVTADEPLWRAVRGDFPEIVLLRDW